MFERISLIVGQLYLAQDSVRDRLRREHGQGAVEYALVVLGIAAIIAAAVAGFANHITSFMSKAGTKLESYVP